MKTLLAILVLVAGAAVAQKKTQPEPPQLPASYEFSTEEKLKVRDLQYVNDQLEIEIQKMQVEIEKKRAQQADNTYSIKAVAYDFALKHGVDLSKYNLEPNAVRFVKK